MSTSPRPVVVRSGEGTPYELGGASNISVRLTAEQTDGALTVFEVDGDLERDAEEARGLQHAHDDVTEIFYIVAGEVDLVSGDDEPIRGLGPGSFVVVPPGVPHALAPHGRWRHVTLVLPGGFDRYFDEVAAALAAGAGDDERLEIAARYGTRPA